MPSGLTWNPRQEYASDRTARLGDCLSGKSRVPTLRRYTAQAMPSSNNPAIRRILSCGLVFMAAVLLALGYFLVRGELYFEAILAIGLVLVAAVLITGAMMILASGR